MPLKSTHKRLEIPMTNEQYSALVAHVGVQSKPADIAAAVRGLLAEAIPSFASATPMPERGKYKRKSDEDNK